MWGIVVKIEFIYNAGKSILQHYSSSLIA